MAEAPSGSLSSPLRLRLWSVVVLLGVAALAIAGCVVTRHVVSDQERKLLKQRTDEAGLYLSSALGSVQSQMSSIAGTAAVSHEDPNTFAADNKLLTSIPNAFKTIALIRTTPTLQLVATAGTPIDANEPARVNAVTAAAAKAGPTGTLIATPLFDGVASARKLGFAYAAPQLSGYVIYVESEVHPTQQTPVTAGQPFSELVAAVYAGPKAAADQLVVSTAGAGHLPLRGHVASTTAAVGQGQPWLLVARARHSLVGSVATVTPWALLGAGLLAALLAAAVVEVLSRRREYAFAVADARTSELQQSLSELAAAHEQLVRQERLAAIGELASTIGHELRNPLGVISNALYLLRSDLAAHPTDAALRHLATADREVSAATVIVSDLLEFARQRDPVMIDVDAVALIEEVLAVVPPPSGINVTPELPGDPVRIIADRDMLRQVLLNLIGNGYQAMPEGGTVTIGLVQDGGMVRFFVHDTGGGMTPETREKLFQPFFTTKARGVGLGLAVTKRIVDAHSGTIDVDSEPGAGATFTVSLPQIRLPHQQVPSSEVRDGAHR